MSRPTKGPRLITRDQGGQLRYYADLRSIGRGRVALIPTGETRATTDPVIAARMLSRLLAEHQEARRDAELLGLRRRSGFAAYAAEHLQKKARSGRATREYLSSVESHLRAAVQFFGAARDVGAIRVEDVQRFVDHLAAQPSGRRREDGSVATLSPASQRRYLASLSNLYTRAQGEGLVQPGYNPVAAMMDKPIGRPGEAPWLEVWEAALLLEAARTYPFDGADDETAGDRLRKALASMLGLGEAAEQEFLRRMKDQGMRGHLDTLHAYLEGRRVPTKRYLQVAAAALEIPEERLHRGNRSWSRRLDRSVYALLAAWLLTGARETEAYGIQLGDVDLSRKRITFRENAHRRLKTRTSYRTVPYWPQLQEILEPHLERRRQEGAGARDLVFVSQRTGAMLVDTRFALDAIAERAGWLPGEIRSKMFRHTYCSTRLQTLDRGAPVSIYTVGRELGHGGDALVKRVYGHLGEIPHRSEVVEYRLEQQEGAIPPERLRLLVRAI